MRAHVTIAVLLALGLAACGDVHRPVPAGDVGIWSTSKPNPVVGQLRAAVLERPAPGIARIAAEWQAHLSLTACGLRIVLPDGVELLDGQGFVPLSEPLDGEYEWIVSFPTDRTLDATIRLWGDGRDGQRACEVAVRLVTVGR